MIKKVESVLKKEMSDGKNLMNQCNWENKNLYADYIAQTFYYVRHSTRLLALAASRLSYEKEQDLHLRFGKHLAEESNHERLALNDLKNLGVSLSDFPERSATKLFYESQYYKVEHIHPLALMGYILYLEGLAQTVCPDLCKRIQDNFGQKCATFLKVHGEEDPEHVEAALKLISGLSDEQLLIIEDNIKQSSHAFIHMIDEIEHKWKYSGLKKAS